MSTITFHPARYYHMVSKATTDEQVWDILDNTKLNMAQHGSEIPGISDVHNQQGIKESSERTKKALTA